MAVDKLSADGSMVGLNETKNKVNEIIDAEGSGNFGVSTIGANSIGAVELWVGANSSHDDWNSDVSGTATDTDTATNRDFIVTTPHVAAWYVAPERVAVPKTPFSTVDAAIIWAQDNCFGGQISIVMWVDSNFSTWALTSGDGGANREIWDFEQFNICSVSDKSSGTYTANTQKTLTIHLRSEDSYWLWIRRGQSLITNIVLDVQGYDLETSSVQETAIFSVIRKSHGVNVWGWPPATNLGGLRIDMSGYITDVTRGVISCLENSINYTYLVDINCNNKANSAVYLFGAERGTKFQHGLSTSEGIRVGRKTTVGTIYVVTAYLTHQSSQEFIANTTTNQSIYQVTDGALGAGTAAFGSSASYPAVIYGAEANNSIGFQQRGSPTSTTTLLIGYASSAGALSSATSWTNSSLVIYYLLASGGSFQSKTAYADFNSASAVKSTFYNDI